MAMSGPLSCMRPGCGNPTDGVYCSQSCVALANAERLRAANRARQAASRARKVAAQEARRPCQAPCTHGRHGATCTRLAMPGAKVCAYHAGLHERPVSWKTDRRPLWVRAAEQHGRQVTS